MGMVATQWVIYYEYGDHNASGCGTIRIHAVEPVVAVRKAMKRLTKTNLPIRRIKVMRP